MKYWISQHYDGNITLEIEANTEDQAIKQFEAEVNELNDAMLIAYLDLSAGELEIEVSQ